MTIKYRVAPSARNWRAEILYGARQPPTPAASLHFYYIFYLFHSLIFAII